ncbi:MAG: restriction endonuclease subunit S, partial [Treponemataceae bacterium]|nr:restriction endonuclease subunit S [Treponemataceae bacterium]
MKYKLSDICTYRNGKVDVKDLNAKTYISTENMLPNKGGITEAASLPTVPLTQGYKKDDVLVSNIRPYFKKIWRAKNDGGCSNDVLVFQANENIDKEFLYYVLANDDFFAYSMATSKGTKMPRGDKFSIMQYEVPNFDLKTQSRIAAVLSALDDKIELNNKINENLEQQAQAIYQSMFVSTQHETDRIGLLSELITVKYGKDHKKLNDGVFPVYGSGGIMRYVEKSLYDKESVLIPRKRSLNKGRYVDEPIWSGDTMYFTEKNMPNIAKIVFNVLNSK